MVSQVISIYLILKLVYPKDKLIAGMLLLFVGILMIGTTGTDTITEVLINDANQGPIEDYNIVQKHMFVNANGIELTYMGGYGMIIIGAALIVLIREILHIANNAGSRKGVKR